MKVQTSHSEDSSIKRNSKQSPCGNFVIVKKTKTPIDFNSESTKARDDMSLIIMQVCRRNKNIFQISQMYRRTHCVNTE